MTITLNDLKTNSKFRGTLFLDMDRGAYENHYQSETYPRLTVIKAGAPNPGFPCWLMGWSDELVSGALRAIQSYRSSRPKSSRRSSTQNTR